MWEHIASFEGINDEFAPLMKMTAPRDVRERGLDGVVVGERLCRSWVLLFKLIPFDYDDITIVRLDPGASYRAIRLSRPGETTCRSTSTPTFRNQASR